MDEMKAKCVEEKNAEVVTFTKFEAFCQDTAAEKNKAISEATESIAQLFADIQKYDSDATVLAEEMGKLDGSIATAEKQLAAATEVRNKEKADFDAIHGEYETNIADLEGAIARIKTMMAGVKSASAASLIQILPSHQQTRNMIKAFLDLGDDQQPAAPVYESKAGGVVDLMKDLKKKLIEEKTVAEKEEMKAVGAYNMIAQTLHDQISKQTDSRDKKTADKQHAEKSSATASGQKGDTEAALAADTEYLSELKTDCAE